MVNPHERKSSKSVSTERSVAGWESVVTEYADNQSVVLVGEAVEDKGRARINCFLCM